MRTSYAAIAVIGLLVAGCSSPEEPEPTGSGPTTEPSAASSQPAPSDEGSESVAPSEGASETPSAEPEPTAPSASTDGGSVGDATDVTDASSGQTYRVTLNDVGYTTDPVDGLTLEELNFNPDTGAQFLVANVTIENTGEESWVPNDVLSIELAEGPLPVSSAELGTFTERAEPLAPGEQISGDLAFTPVRTDFATAGTLHLVYEISTDHEVRVEVPPPSG